ncbi:MAG: hypothetical protein EHM78_02200 [Myxococcaceae bacterium]|nr:MAG: hypothetical protein EHM78_02200 [Myxococcaceae bacterium]
MREFYNRLLSPSGWFPRGTAPAWFKLSFAPDGVSGVGLSFEVTEAPDVFAFELTVPAAPPVRFGTGGGLGWRTLRPRSLELHVRELPDVFSFYVHPHKGPEQTPVPEHVRSPLVLPIGGSVIIPTLIPEPSPHAGKRVQLTAMPTERPDRFRITVDFVDAVVLDDDLLLLQ